MKDNKNIIPQIFLVDASAGAGKTYILATKYLYYVFNQFRKLDLPFKNILAITFTNKAAKEMKLRIIDFLKKIYLDDFENEEFKNNFYKELNIIEYNKEKIKEIALNLLELLFNNYQYFQVKTIDSFVNGLILNCALLLDIMPNFKIEKKYDDYIEYCVDLLIDKTKNDVKLKKIFKNFIYTYLMIEYRKSWFPKDYIIKINKILYEYTRIYGKDFKKVFKDNFNLKIKKLSDELIKNFKFLYSHLDKNLNKNFYLAIEEIINKEKIKNYILTSKDFDKKIFFEDNKIIKNIILKNKEVYNVYKKTKFKIVKLLEYEFFNAYNSYLEIFKYLEKEIKNLSKDKNFIFLDELNHLFNKLINKEIFPEIYLRLSAKILHFMIDEFQDTNKLQWINIYPLIYESIASNGSLFIVGDKKQSIYRFRGGDPTLFDKITNFYFKNYKYQKNFLTKNYRSSKAIVEFNNKVFSKNNLENFLSVVKEIKDSKDSVEEILNIYLNTNQQYINDGGYVYGELIKISQQNEVEEIIKSKLLNLIYELINKKISLSNIAILLRKNSEVEMVTKWLVEQGISVESEKTLDIRENKLIKEIIAFLKFLVNPNDDISFCCFILGDIFTKSICFEKEEFNSFIFLANNFNSSPIYKKFKEKYPNLWNKYFSNFLEWGVSLPLYDLILKIYSIFNVLENFSNLHGFLMSLLDLVYKKEDDDCSIENFIDYFENSSKEEIDFYVKIKQGDAIKITTIHKAKGLEFDIVIIPMLNITVKVGEQKYINSKFIIKEEKNFLEIVKVKRKPGKYIKNIYDIYKKEFEKLLIDEINSVYVAFTRAKKQLYFFVPDNEDNEKIKNYAKYLIPWNENFFVCFGEFDKNDFNYKKLEQNNLLKISPSKYEDWIVKMNDEESLKDKKNILYRDEILKGDIFHKILSFIYNLYNKDLDFEIKNAIEKTKIYFPYVKNWSFFEILIKSFLANEKIKPFFFIPKAEIYCEKEIVSSEGDIYRIDRFIILDNEILLIDYKLSYNKDLIEQYIKQIENYKNLLLSIYKNKKLRCFLLFLENFESIEI